jgi:uncharacterized protein YndB with AHSA1/START domain
MGHFTIEVEIHAPPQRVWHVMQDVERWPEWTPSVTSIERLDEGPLAAGSRARIRQAKLLPATWRVTAIEEGKGFTWVTRGPGVTVTGHHVVEPIPHGSRATLSLRFSGALGPLVGWLTRGINERYLAMEAAGLKRRCETA